MPRAEVSAHADRFEAFGIDVYKLFSSAERSPGYLDFPSSGWQGTTNEIPALAAPKKTELLEAFDDWWSRHVKHIKELPITGPGRVMDTRRDLLESFRDTLKPLGVLDRFQLAGVVASWWGDVQYDVRTLAFHGYGGVVQGWLTTIEAAFEADDEDDAKDARTEARNAARIAAEKRRAREHPCVPLLIPDYLAALEEAEARKADLDAQVKAATAKPSEDGEEETDDVFEQGLSALELKRLKADQAAARKELKRLEAEFLDRLKAAIAKLDGAEEESLVLQILRSDLAKRLEGAFDAGPRWLTDRYRTWADKYAVPLFDLQNQQSVAEAAFSAYLKDLGYA